MSWVMTEQGKYISLDRVDPPPRAQTSFHVAGTEWAWVMNDTPGNTEGVHSGRGLGACTLPHSDPAQMSSGVAHVTFKEAREHLGSLKLSVWDRCGTLCQAV